ncbi:MAG: hypothetical protein C4581_04915 [Nitrospiraceae bacterium]|nr:MAG: hypothetical protein C4581_04915 [Nitrospiraceae bacterium]
MQRRIDLPRFIALFVFLFGSGFSCSLSDPEIGKKYSNLSELETAESERGFVLLGKFEGDWPCKVTAVEKAMDEISFSLQNHGSHGYPGYDGYELKLVRFNCDGNTEAGYVFRSKEKK